MSDIKTLLDLGLHARGGRNPRILGLETDSARVRDGTLFAAMPGTRVHGAKYAAQAVEAGAAAILTDAEGARLIGDALDGRDVALVVAQDARQALAQTASLWFGAHPEIVVAVTGTNGKTSVTTFTRQIWEALGFAGINLGTTGVEGAWTAPLAHTTPDPLTLHRVLAEADEDGVTHAAMEASSHGLDQRRLDGVVVAAAGFTNFTQDHLDYHETFEAYFDAKMGLFTRVLADDGVAVVNLDDPRGQEVASLCTLRGIEVIGCGRHADARLRITGQRFDDTGQDIQFTWQDRPFRARLNLIGGFQAENVVLACGLAIAAGALPGDVFRTLPELTTVRGRMQLVAQRENGATIFVDYAHTPDAVETALEALRPHVMGRIVVVLGAGGDRDSGKRPLMGRAAAENADMVVVTDDNPRSERPADIRAAVLSGAIAAHAAEVTEVGDRAEAILRGIDALGPGDALLIAGKGHETGQIVGDTVLPFDDAEQASVAVAALEGRI
ncbi:UDP-N-acetylmuramoyl-L-alanyl-D-glutamate--2,6-diaminopimelate ligase [Salipiger sp. IMCC34102]|uniref:UDP-N-acetylmuramoyl-L-alanyl-D-glutamate--2, 6-diaminopimelate ligase n=1 Tax=Salipiger sp. IMCC34102 TaxID=2510647 RepID=UPI00101C815E|nr:UDP-N-acetylmuramoyl-L-alanyl-D-glutamate--2,6-diaminopimelate ligase [Salipiger sp. IMCC34102]RYH02678.1 UDP-N-acetylmuramoyl-L-alanyl-D-glutamate--2,6-diaminopimelate ligase [Salipiger sp. IMCC34102]